MLKNVHDFFFRFVNNKKKTTKLNFGFTNAIGTEIGQKGSTGGVFLEVKSKRIISHLFVAENSMSLSERKSNPKCVESH